MQEQQILDTEDILNQATDLEVAEYQLFKKEDIENQTFVIFKIKEINSKGEKFYNFQAVDISSKMPFCFNGGDILNSQLEGIELPVRVKLVRVEKKEVTKGKTNFYWSFVKP